MNVRGERGSASLWALALAMVAWISTVAAVLVGVAVTARHRASAAADLAALAAAAAETRATVSGAMLSGTEPAGAEVGGDTASACAAAVAIAVANDATLVECRVTGSVVEVTAAVRVPGLAHLALGSVSASARAGPS
jgi:secretion/DNA translocation related TadE-like protein